jgi:hypothetical protein
MSLPDTSGCEQATLERGGLAEKLSGRLLYQFVRVGFAGHYRIDRFATVLLKAFSSLALTSLDAESLRQLTMSAYRKSWRLSDRGLYGWEKEWFKRDLPPPPAKLLVGGAGRGREVLALARMGYTVVAFEPVQEFVHLTATKAVSGFNVECFSGFYEDMLDEPGHMPSTLLLEIEKRAPVDAILFGWGSFSHIPGTDNRLKVLKKCVDLCSQGPILVSYLTPLLDEPSENKSRVHRLVHASGRLFNHLTNRKSVAETGDRFLGKIGYCHYFKFSDIRKLGRELGRKVIVGPDLLAGVRFPHATFVVPTSQE